MPFLCILPQQALDRTLSRELLMGQNFFDWFSPAFPYIHDHLVFSELLKWKSMLQGQVLPPGCLNVNINNKK